MNREFRRALFLLLTPLFPLGCQQERSLPDVRFSLGQADAVVDSSQYFWKTTTKQPILAFGSDSAGTYLVFAQAKEGVSMAAGEKPKTEQVAALVQDGEGILEMVTQAKRCGEIISEDCLDEYVDPEHSFEVTGYVGINEAGTVDSVGVPIDSLTQAGMLSVDLLRRATQATRIDWGTLYASVARETSEESQPPGELAPIPSEKTSASAVREATVPEGTDVYGDFYYQANRDAMTDEAEDQTFTADTNMEVAFGFKCLSGRPRGVVLISDRMTRLQLISFSDEGPYLQYRFGSEPAVGPTRAWLWDDDSYLWMAPSGTTHQLIESAKNAQMLSIRVYDDEGDHVDTWSLSLSGARDAIKRLPCT